MKTFEIFKQELYSAIYDTIVDLRIDLNLYPTDDIVIAQLANKIWDKQKPILEDWKNYKPIKHRRLRRGSIKKPS